MGKYSKGSRVVVSRDTFVPPSDLYNELTNGDNWNTFRYLFGDVGIFGFKPLKMFDEYNYMNDYLRNRGLSWSDMKYPSLAPKSGSGNWKVSTKAVERLYK